MQAQWMERWFQAQYGDGWATPFVVLAPDLQYAFKLARTQHPTADAWRCLGAVDDEVEVML